MNEEQELQIRIAREIDGISPTRQALDRKFLAVAGVVAGTLLRRWLLVANLVNAVILAGAIAVPVMMAAGFSQIAAPLFSAYHILCEQLPSRSYFILGYQLALDQRMLAIYGSNLLAGIAFIPMRRRLKPLSWRAYFLLTLPIAVDGTTQLFGWRLSNWELRTATGGLFGAATVWLAYPHLELVVRSLLLPADKP